MQPTQMNFPQMLAQVLRANEGNRITPELMQGLLTAAIEIHNACMKAHVEAQAAVNAQVKGANQGEPNALV